MKIILLTHQREQYKSTGTGQLVKQVLQESCDVIEWHRKQPNDTLTSIDHLRTALVYPIMETAKWPIKTLPEESIQQIEHFIILDGTWQEAQKIYNRSPYLHSLYHYALSNQKKSEYLLRRNQKSIGLCTAEVAIEILQLKAQNTLSDRLRDAFALFNAPRKPNSSQNSI
ncbi:DTW domain-containing protein [Marinomonas sp. 2405UD68-3]|uniref:DTW domain-containing protein n=1 Tax=Marinomonas sp. 2405UD68-3 TaxID=3391835 RepID=UPI0039C9A762